MSTGGEIAIGIVSSIVYDAIKRPFKGMVDATVRRKAINKAIASSASENVELARKYVEIDDIIKVIANDHGEFDTDVQNFLISLQRSAIPDALKQCAICGRDSEGIFSAFDMLYRSHAPLTFSSRQIFDALNAAIKIRLEQSTGDVVLLDAIKANSSDLSQRIDGLVRSFRDLKSIDPIPSVRYHELVNKIAKGIEGENRYINVETNQGTKKLSIKKLVIPARLSALSAPDMPIPHREAVNEKSTAIPYLTFRRMFNREVILGDPGGGKSTLTQLICYDLANQIILESATPGHKSFDSRDFVLPIRIILRTLEKRQQLLPSYGIFDYIVDELKLYIDSDYEMTRRFVRQSLGLGHLALLFDGLDEVLEVDVRRNVAALIEKFTHAYAACPALVTSRIVGYKDAPLNSDFDISTLSRFNKDEVRRFSQLLMQAVAGQRKNEAVVNADKFIIQTESNAVDLRENPLLLGLMVYIYIARGDVPNNRPEIYKECSLLMFDKWDQRRGIIYTLPKDFNLLDVFGFTAEKIFGSADLEDGVSEDWLRKTLQEFFNEWYDADRRRAFESAKVLVEFITGRAWVMCEIGPGVYKFTHRTFLEYFLARRLEEVAGGVTGLVNNYLAKKIVKAEWDVVSHLSLQISTFRSGPKSVQAANALIKYGQEKDLNLSDIANHVMFMSSALEYLILPESKLKEYIEYIFERIVRVGAGHSLISIEIIHELIESGKKRTPFVEDRVRDLARHILRGSSSNERTSILYLIGARYSGFKRARGSHVYALTSSVWNVFSDVRKEINADQLRRAALDVAEARSHIYVYRDDIVFLYEKWRLSLFGKQNGVSSPWELQAFPIILIRSCFSIFVKGGGGYPDESKMTDAQKSKLIYLMSEDFLTAWKSGTAKDNISILFPNSYALFDEMLDFMQFRGSKASDGRLREVYARFLFCVVFIMFAVIDRGPTNVSTHDSRARGAEESLWNLIQREIKWAPADEFKAGILEIIDSVGLRDDQNPLD